jgi:hypothetical protein
VQPLNTGVGFSDFDVSSTLERDIRDEGRGARLRLDGIEPPSRFRDLSSEVVRVQGISLTCWLELRRRRSGPQGGVVQRLRRGLPVQRPGKRGREEDARTAGYRGGRRERQGRLGERRRRRNTANFPKVEELGPRVCIRGLRNAHASRTTRVASRWQWSAREELST